VVHAVSTFYERSGHMSPVAAALAAGLHVATALALFLVSPLNRHDVDTDVGSAIDVTIEQPKPPEEPPPPPPQEAVKPQPPPQPTPPPQPPAAQPAPPPPPPAAAQKLQPQRNPASKEQLGLPPQGAIEPDKKPEAKPEPKAEAKLEPKPEPPAEPKPEPQEAAAQPTEPTPPAPAPVENQLEKVLPPVEQPPAPLSMRDFVKALPPPPPAPPPSPPAQRPAPPQQHPQQPQPSPLSERPPPREQQEASVSAFQNPAAAYSHARVHDDYLIGIARRMSQYRFVPKSMTGLNTQGVVVLSLVVARDGRLLNSGIAKSSGNPPMDAAVLETAQKAAPYGPLPPEITGNSTTFMLSVPYKFVAGQ
jgi:TonB family protein